MKTPPRVEPSTNTVGPPASSVSRGGDIHENLFAAEKQHLKVILYVKIGFFKCVLPHYKERFDRSNVAANQSLTQH